jgi:Ca2+-transporting ATPase
MALLYQDGTGAVAYAKGAPEVILDRCTRLLGASAERPLVPGDRQRAFAAYRRLADQGLRTLALARRRFPEPRALRPDALEQELTLLGLVGIQDPPRPEAPDAVQRARRAGIRVLMLTGDAPDTALAIAREIGLPADRVVTGPELEAGDAASLAAALRGTPVFARVTPEQKLRIAETLQAEGHVVAMTGDGVNDAPALRRADIGVAMGIRGTEVSREAADLVLTDDNFASIVNAVQEGRRQLDNVQKFVRYLLSSNTGEVIAIFANIALGGPLILLPVQILWINMVTDAASAVALGVEPAERDVMRWPPRDPREPIVSRGGVATILALGSYIGLAALALFQWYLAGSGDQAARAQTVAFTGMVVLEKVNLFNFRALRAPVWTVGLASNPWLLVAASGTLLLQTAAVYAPPLQAALHTAPLTAADWALIAVTAAPLFLVPEGVKWLRSRRSRREA